ncbi:hypothetical protein ZIOFF_008981 [Zingiber officinale]|uniref:DNA-directed RNA polymerase subunit n=1 Tax=Zingiber officinale TaxID=94328 RepID=A0A8J5LXL8_ZINOF|nr:hypothetical protein ZIOFF_008981 [Zingiber officinale]
MFCLSLIEHNLRLPPHLLNRPLVDAIKDELERLYLDKVITNLGLCISVYDIQSLEGGFIYPGEGSSTYKVVFRLLIFRPFVGEVICAKLKASDATGLHLTLGFFNDIHVPVHLLPKESEVGEDGIWVWKHEFGDLAMDLDEEVNVRVTKINYPSSPLEQDANAQPFAPMQIIAKFFEKKRGKRKGSVTLYRSMASFGEAPPGDLKAGEKIFKTKCVQCHTVEKGAGRKQGQQTHLILNRSSNLIRHAFILNRFPTRLLKACIFVH